MKNKFTALILLITVLSALIPSQIFAANIKTTPHDAVAFMNVMNFITENESKEDRLGEEISRVQFVSYLARILNINETSTSDVDYYYDVPSDHWGKYSVNTLVELGILTVGQDRNFRPDDTITKTEASVIAAICLGRLEEAVIRGGYPHGYIAIATEEKLFKGASSGEKMTLQSAIVFLFNLINAEIMQPEFPGDGSSYAKNGKTLLSEYHDIFYTEGYVNAVWGTSVDEKVAHDENEVIIGDDRYTSEAWCYNYLGQKVKFFYKEAEEDERELIYIFSDAEEENEVLYITSDNYLGYADKRISYRNEHQARKTIDITDGVTIIRNGENVSGNIDNAMRPFYGKMKIINSGKFGDADVVIIEDYVNIVADSIISDKKIVYDMYDNQNFVNSSDDNGKISIIIDSLGNKTDFDSITKGAVLSVAESSDNSFALIRINSDIVVGTIDAVEVDSIDDTYIEIEGNTHTVLKSFYDTFSKIFVVGASGTFKKDALGKIVFFTMDKEGDMQLAFVIKGRITQNLNGKELDHEAATLKLFSESGLIETVACAQKVRIDEDLKRTPDEIMAVFNKDGVFVPQLVRLRYNAAGEIKEIDTKTPATGGRDSRYALNHINPVNANPLVYSTGLVDKDIWVAPTTKMFVVPASPQGDYPEDAFEITTFAQLKKGITSRLDIYKLDSESVAVDVVVHYKETNPTLDRWTPLYVVEKVGTAINSDDQQVIALTLDATGVNEEYLVAENYAVRVNSIAESTTSGVTSSGMNPANLGKGDIIRMALNYKNEITDIQQLLDYSIASSNPRASFFNNAVHPFWRISGAGLPGHGFQYDVTSSYGYVARVEGNYFQWGYAKPGDVNQIFNLGISSNTKLYVYDDDEPDKLRQGSIADLVGYHQNPDNYSRIFTRTEGTTIRQCFIFN